MLILIDRDAKAVEPVRMMLYRMRIHTLCLSPEELDAVAAYPARALLIPRPDTLPELTGLCQRVRATYPGLPLALLHRSGLGNYYSYLPLADLVFEDESTTSTKLVTALFDLFEERNGRSARQLLVGDVATRIEEPCFYIYGHPVASTPLHHCILRYLQMIYPRAASIEELLSTCFSFVNPPGANNVSTQICLLNRSLRPYLHRNAIGFFRGEGYRILRGPDTENR